MREGITKDNGKWIKCIDRNTSGEEIDFDLDCLPNVIDAHILDNFMKLQDVDCEIRRDVFNRHRDGYYFDKPNIYKKTFEAIGAIEALYELKLEIAIETLGEDNCLEF